MHYHQTQPRQIIAQDQCELGTYHSDQEEEHREGSYFTPEITWLNDLYGAYEPAITLEQYSADESMHYTHSPGHKPLLDSCLLYTSPSPRDGLLSRMPSSA